MKSNPRFRSAAAFIAAAATGAIATAAWSPTSSTDRDGGSANADVVQVPSVNPRTGVRWYREINYAGAASTNAEKQVLDLYLPKDGEWMEGKPLFIWIHGGGWIMGDKDDAMGLYGRFCRNLAESGIAAANVSYRLSPEVKHPGHIEDLAKATAWLVGHAEKFGYDATHIFVSGHSAGGHLAALLAVDQRWLKAEDVDPEAIMGAIPSSGVYDLRPMFEGRVAFGGAFPPGTAEDASPVAHLDPSDPPFLLFVEAHGRYMRDQTETMVAALERASIAHEVVEIPRSNHITMLSDLAREDGVALTRTIAHIESQMTDRGREQPATESGRSTPPDESP